MCLCLCQIYWLLFATLCPLFVFQVKKSKKKAKQAVKETKTVTTDGKEPEEGKMF